jgi:hypothetical protein
VHNIPIEVLVAHDTQHAAASAALLACENATAEVGEIPLVTLNALTHCLCPLLTFCEVSFDLLPMTQVVSDDHINIC